MSMKRRAWIIVVALAIMSLPVFGYSQEIPEISFYYSFGNKVAIEVLPGRFMLKKSLEITKEQLEEKVNTILENANYDWFNSDICTVLTDERLIDDAISQLKTESMIESARRVYVTLSDKQHSKGIDTQEPLALGLIDQIILKFKEGVDDSVKRNIKDSFHLTDFENNKLFEVCLVPKEEDILSLANRIYETGFFEYAYPELVSRVTLHDDNAFYPNDPYFQYQFALHNTGQTVNGHSGYADADIDAPEAWALTVGSEDIVIAVIDHGVTSDHPDLPNTRQVRLTGSNFGNGDPDDPSPVGNDNHGNACAGVIAATANNQEGIAGIAPLCKIMPVRFDNQTLPAQMANAIIFAADNGAKIISNSWGYKSTNNDLYPCVVGAISYAVEEGCLVLFSAGNNANHIYPAANGSSAFPANRKINGKLTVGASDRYDNQANYSPTDSCIDIVAPSNRAVPSQISGENYEMWSLDISGNSGYNPVPSDQFFEDITFGSTLPSSGTNFLSYTGLFGGTSHSCPVVAGVAALVLSLNSELTPMALCSVLKNTADKVGGYTYVNGRCDEMGYGRVNANNAVWAVCDTTHFVGPVNVPKTVTGCDVELDSIVMVYHNSTLRVRARNSTIIKGLFGVEIGSKLEIIPYRPDE